MSQPVTSPTSVGDAVADKIITALEGRFRDWLGQDEYAEARPMIAEIIDRELGNIAASTEKGQS